MLEGFWEKEQKLRQLTGELHHRHQHLCHEHEEASHPLHWMVQAVRLLTHWLIQIVPPIACVSHQEPAKPTPT
jgi:hypothetical protein